MGVRGVARLQRLYEGPEESVDGVHLAELVKRRARTQPRQPSPEGAVEATLHAPSKDADKGR